MSTASETKPPLFLLATIVAIVAAVMIAVLPRLGLSFGLTLAAVLAFIGVTATNVRAVRRGDT